MHNAQTQTHTHTHTHTHTPVTEARGLNRKLAQLQFYLNILVSRQTDRQTETELSITVILEVPL